MSAAGYWSSSSSSSSSSSCSVEVPLERTLSITTTADSLDEALTVAVQLLDSHQFKAGTYLIEIISAVEETDDGEDCYFDVFVQGALDDD